MKIEKRDRGKGRERRDMREKGGGERIKIG